MFRSPADDGFVLFEGAAHLERGAGFLGAPDFDVGAVELRDVLGVLVGGVDDEASLSGRCGRWS